MELKERIEKLESSIQQNLRLWRIYWFDFNKPSVKFHSDEYALNLYAAKKLSFKKVSKPYPNAQFLRAKELTKKEISTHIKESTQSLFFAGNEPPSVVLKKKTRVYGFSSLEFAKGWKKKNNYNHVYQFMSSNYILDKRVFVRDTDTGRQYNDNEYICLDVTNERKIE